MSQKFHLKLTLQVQKESLFQFFIELKNLKKNIFLIKFLSLVYDALTGKVEAALSGHKGCVRDVSWHPYNQEIISTSVRYKHSLMLSVLNSCFPVGWFSWQVDVPGFRRHVWTNGREHFSRRSLEQHAEKECQTGQQTVKFLHQQWARSRNAPILNLKSDFCDLSIILRSDSRPTRGFYLDFPEFFYMIWYFFIIHSPHCWHT